LLAVGHCGARWGSDPFNGPIKGKPLVRVEVRRWAEHNWLGYHDVARFIGTLKVAGGIPGYLVTTSSFTDAAKTAASAVGDSVRLIDGKRLLRYITYVGGSRLTGQYAGSATAPIQPTSPAWLAKADEIVQKTVRPPRHPRVLVVANSKGGVAKTTTALNIGFALADLHKQRVLLVDMDGQGSLSRSLPRPLPKGAAKDAPAPEDSVFLTNYFRSKVPLATLVRPTRFPNLSLIPAHVDLYRLQFGGADRARAELQFVEDIRPLKLVDDHGVEMPPFDWIILDTPATETFYGRAALAAADYAIIPAFAEAFALQGAGSVLITAKTMGALMGDVDRWTERILGCVVTRWKSGTNADATLAGLRLYLNNTSLSVFKQAIPQDDRVETANRGTMAGGGRSIFRLTAQMGVAARAYDEVVKEMLEHVNRREANG
jgi:chromosome partitioning protein